MPANITLHDAIFPVKTISGNTEKTASDPELAGQTFKRGVPVQMTAAGFIQQWDGSTITAGIAGVSLIIGSNLGTNGQGAPTAGFGQITGNKAISTYGSVQSEANAVNIALGTPASDGRTLYAVANLDTMFRIMVDNASGAVAADYTPTLLAMKGKSYGVTIDANGYPYLDFSKATVGTNAVFQVVEYSPIDGNAVNGHVHGFFLKTAAQING